MRQWHGSKVQSIEDSKRIESSLAGTGPGSIAETVPRLLNALAGTNVLNVGRYFGVQQPESRTWSEMSGPQTAAGREIARLPSAMPAWSTSTVGPALTATTTTS